ncbi:UNKNOWN [Stylonychia lemnae]|uniref:Uncharacterized protein n=1 Tax=Stylonychia lemnae TaxID=5949 RepID=A0A078AVR2_STYLE|nr:UNKNOWN [Stylonychia lemnae]|eukprot:CDW86500.1 UNKNOWN [Stylonychia lemnae]
MQNALQCFKLNIQRKQIEELLAQPKDTNSSMIFQQTRPLNMMKDSLLFTGQLNQSDPLDQSQDPNLSKLIKDKKSDSNQNQINNFMNIQQQLDNSSNSQSQQNGQNFKSLEDLVNLLSNMPEFNSNRNLSSIQTKLTMEINKLQTNYEELERLRLYLNNKIEIVEQMELENLETHMAVEYRLKNSEEHKKLITKFNNADCQTETTFQELLQSEKQIEFQKNEIQLLKFKDQSEFEQKNRQLTRRERDLDIRERLTEEKRVEYTFKQRELNQRLKNAISWPLNCLENDQILGEKITDVKLTPDLFKGMNLDVDKNFIEFKNREVNQKLLKNHQGGELYLKLEQLLKYEFVILQERVKNGIVKQYMEGELTRIENERLELGSEREKYSMLIEQQRQVEEEKNYLEQQRIEVQALLDNLKRYINLIQFDQNYINNQQIFNQMMNMNADNLGQSNYPFSQHFAQNSLHGSQTYISSQNNNRGSVFDIAIQNKSSNILSQGMIFGLSNHQSQLSNQPRIIFSERIQHILNNFEKLESNRIQRQDNVLNQEDKLQNLRKVILREAYFIDQERKYLNEKSQQITKSPRDRSLSPNNITRGGHSQQRSVTAFPSGMKFQGMNESLMMDGSKIAFNPLNNFADEYKSLDVFTDVDEERKKIKVLQQSLMMENEMNQTLNNQLNKEIERIKKHNPDSQISLELEVSDEEMNSVLNKFREKKQKKDLTQQQKFEILLNSVESMSQHLFLKSSENTKFVFNQSIESLDQSHQATYFLMVWKMHTLQKRLENDKARKLLQSLDTNTLTKLGLMPQFKREFGQQKPIMDWFDAFWYQKSRQLNIESFKKMNGEQLFLISQNLENELEKFWKFRCLNVIKMVNLHMRRRARLLLAFAFQEYKYQTMKSKVQFILQLKENVINISRHQNNTFQSINVGANDSIKNIGGDNDTDGEDNGFNQIIALGTPRLADSLGNRQETIDNSRVFGDTTENIQRNTRVEGGIETNNSQTYTGISDIIMNQNMQNMKRNAILTYLLLRKGSNQEQRLKNYGLNKWKNFMREVEMWYIKNEIKRLVSEVENLKFQEQLLRTNFRLQKNELESKVNELITFCLGNNQNNNQAPISY